MNSTQNLPRILILTGLVIAAALYRILPHPWNYSPLGAMSLFAGAYFSNRIIAFVLPLITIWISDLVINNILLKAYFPEFTLFYEGFYWQYASYILIVFIGSAIKGKIKPVNVFTGSVSSSVLFFIITNFGTWVTLSTYPKTAAGLVTCYIAGLPYFPQTLFGDLIFSAILFGSFELLQYRFPALKLKTA